MVAFHMHALLTQIVLEHMDAYDGHMHSYIYGMPMHTYGMDDYTNLV